MAGYNALMVRKRAHKVDDISTLELTVEQLSFIESQVSKVCIFTTCCLAHASTRLQ